MRFGFRLIFMLWFYVWLSVQAEERLNRPRVSAVASQTSDTFRELGRTMKSGGRKLTAVS